MHEIEASSGFKLSLPLDIGLNSSSEVPHFALDRVHEYSWFGLSVPLSDLDALCKIAELSARNNPPFHVQHSPLTNPILEDVFQWTQVANEKHFGFEIWGINSGLQFTFLDGQTDVPEWQCIRTPGKASVKMLGIICLSASDEAHGGDIEFLSTLGPVELPFRKGVVYYFPSWTSFRFTPVSEGARLYAAFSVFGPSFK